MCRCDTADEHETDELASKWLKKENNTHTSYLLHSLWGKCPWERYEPPYPPSYGLNSTTTVLLGEWAGHSITYKGWYAVKQTNQIKPDILLYQI